MQILHYISRRVIRTADLPTICFYCGEPGHEREHVYPRSVFGERGYKVWSCRECNLIAGAKVFEDIEEKANYIRSQLAIKYRKLYTFPDWDEEEINELKGALKQRVRASMEGKKWIRRRLRWHTNLSVMSVVKYLEKSDIGSDSVVRSAETNGIPLSEMRSLIELD